MKENGLFKSCSEQSIYSKIRELRNKSPEEYSKIRSKWTQEELKTLKDAIEKKGGTISIRAFARDLAGTELFESRSEESICRKIHYLKNKSLEEHSKIEGKNGKDLVQEEPKTLDDDLLRELGESLDKYIKNIEQFENIESNSLEEVGEEESEQQLLNDLHKAGLEIPEIPEIGFSLSFKPSNTSDKDSISRDTCYSLNSSSSEHSM